MKSSNGLIGIYEQSGLYQNFLKNLPEGLNNPYLQIIILIGLTAFLIITIREFVGTMMWRRRNRRNLAGKEDHRESFESEDAYIDNLTKLYNQRGYEKHFEAADQKTMAIVYMDVNNLKLTNDTLGHNYGNKLIMATADCIKELWPNQGHRTGGDEFIVITEDGPNVISQKIIKMRNKLQELTDSNDVGLKYQTAVGFANGDGVKSKKEIEEEAEQAMYLNKKELKAEKGYIDPRATNVEAPEVKFNSSSPKKKVVGTTNADLLGLEKPQEEYDERELYELKEVKKVKTNVEIIEEVPTEPEKIDYSGLLDEKTRETAGKTEESNGLDEILQAIKKKEEEQKSLDEYSRKTEEMKQKNMEILEKGYIQGLRVEKNH